MTAPPNIIFVYHGSWVEYVKDGDPKKPLLPSERKRCDEIVERLKSIANGRKETH